MPSPVQESLIALAKSINVPQPTQVKNGKFETQLTSPGPLQVPDTTPVRSVAGGSVDLGFVLKNVRFTRTDITDLNMVGGMPIQLFATQLLDGSTTTAGIPGLLGSLKGTVPVVIDSVGSLLAVQVQARVSIQDDKGRLDPYVKCSFTTGGEGFGGQVTSVPSTALPKITLEWRIPVQPEGVAPPGFVGAFAELASTLETDPPNLPIQMVNRTVIVEVNLSAAGVSTGWVALPPVTTSIPAIPIPTLVAFFDDWYFNGGAGDNGTLVLLPDDSPLDLTAQPASTLGALLSDALGTLRDLVRGLVTNTTGTAGFNPFNPLAPLADIINNLVTDLTTHNRPEQIHFAKASSVPFLDSGFLIYQDKWATDRISSMLVLGPTGLTVHCYNNVNFEPSGGAFDVRVGPEMAVAVPSLVPAVPASYPLGDLTVTAPPAPPLRFDNSFNDMLSSVQIVKP